MTSKKRTGNDPEAGINTPNISNTPGSTNTPNTPHRGQGYSSEYLNGRRGLLRELQDRGAIPESRLSLELLFLLPDPFISFYSELFHHALKGGADGSSVMHGRSGGLGRSKGQVGMALGSDTMLQATGGGKKYKNTGLVIGSEKALTVKTWVDRELNRITQEAIRKLRNLAIAEKIANNAQKPGDETPQGPGASIGQTNRCQGLRRSYVDRSEDDAAMAAGWTRPQCGMFLKATWIFCPECGTKVDNRGLG